MIRLVYHGAIVIGFVITIAGAEVPARQLLALRAEAFAAQAPQGRGGRGGPPPTPRASAPVDLTGNWVSVVSEDWRWRMITPPKGDYANIPLNAAARKIADAWDPSRDETAGEQCKGYAAPAIMREPTRLRISWVDDYTLKIETDAGMQTRVLQFARPENPPGAAPAAAGQRSWQGVSVARWEPPPQGGRGLSLGLAPRAGTQGRSLEVVTNQIRPGYLRKKLSDASAALGSGRAFALVAQWGFRGGTFRFRISGFHSRRTEPRLQPAP